MNDERGAATTPGSKSNGEPAHRYALGVWGVGGSGEGRFAAARRRKITLEYYQELIDQQNNKCAICNQEETRMNNGKLTRLCIDHCHSSGKVRGLLCHACNTAIGKFKDDISLLNSAILYLNSHN